MDVRKKNKTLVYTVPVPWYTFSTKKMKNSPPSSPPSLPLPFAIIAPRPPTYVYYVRTILPTYNLNLTYALLYLRTILLLRTSISRTFHLRTHYVAYVCCVRTAFFTYVLS